MTKISLFIAIILFTASSLKAATMEELCKDAKPPYYHRIGSCYEQGVHYEKNKEKAKIYYLLAAADIVRPGQAASGISSAIKLLLLDSDSPVEKAMGFYLAQKFSTEEYFKEMDEPEYDGDINLRGATRYYLSIHLARVEKHDPSNFYLSKSLEDNFYPAAYAILYLNEAEKTSPPLTESQAEALMQEGIEKQKKYFHWEYPIDYSCWLEKQLDGDQRRPAFPVDKRVVKQLLQKHGSCKQE